MPTETVPAEVILHEAADGATMAAAHALPEQRPQACARRVSAFLGGAR
ncbi:MAG: hypothetical protein ACRDUY_05900 [Nitriliruptorales bacterium]